MITGKPSTRNRLVVSEPKGSSRQFPLDAWRGLAIVLMALDHTNHFVAQQHSSGEYWGGPFPEYDSTAAFLLRLVTHLAAPSFFFLMGVSMVLFSCARQRVGWSRRAIISHFWLRGATLIVLQLVMVNQAWALSPGGWSCKVYIGVLFALGGTMIVGSLLLSLRPFLLLTLTVLLLVAVEILMPDPGMWKQPMALFYRLAMVPGGNSDLWVNYPVLPWLALVTLGLAYGRWLVERQEQAYHWALWLGLALVLAAMLLRTADGFGNIRPRPGDTWVGFFSLVKYPPSVTFIFFTLGAGLVMLHLLDMAGDTIRNALRPLSVFGRVPLFFYLAHLFTYLVLGHILAPSGTDLAVMLAFWVFGLLSLFPLCLWYGNFKARQPVRALWHFL
jgi:uncharacterized membrane protein